MIAVCRRLAKAGVKSRFSNRASSRMSSDRWRESFNEREIGRIKRIIVEKEKEERRNNIVLKGVGPKGKAMKEWVEEFIKEKLGVEIKVVRCKLSGKVIVAMLEGEEEKRRVMGKFKLKGGCVFLEHDLSWEERKVQERMNKWAKTER